MSAVIAGLLKKIALDLGKRGYKTLTEVSPLYKAIMATIDSLPDVEARPSLSIWCKSDEFAQLLEHFKAGDRTLTDEGVIGSFIEATDFYMGDVAQTRMAAAKVLTAFTEKLQDEIYNAPGGISAFARREEELHDRTYRTILNLGEQVVSDRQTELSAAPADLLEACRKVTGRAAHELIDNQRTIVRESVRARIDEFLLSHTRYCFILGPTGVGKSIVTAQEAERLPGAGWTALLLLGTSFSLERTAALIGQELPRQVGRLDWRRIVEPWRAGGSPVSSGLVILIDAIEEADEDLVARQLRLLHEETSDLPLKRFKVIVSCRDFVWSRFRHNRALPFYEDRERLRRPSVRGSLLLGISDFKPDELDRALRMIGAAELLTAGRHGQKVDPHIATLRDLLKHPGTFEHYANLQEGGDVSSIQNLTWSGLIRQRIATCLERAERLSGASADILFNYLIRVAVLGWERGSQDFQVGRTLIEEALPSMNNKEPKAKDSAYEALLETGVLTETSHGQAGMSVGFKITDAGAYLLSFELEKQVAGKNQEETRTLVDEWLVRASNYYPLLDALLAFIDRLATNPFNPSLLTLIEALVEKYHFRSASMFRLVSPAIITSIFEIIKQESRRDYFAYRDAALEMRASPESLAVMRRHLRHPNPLARELAAQMAGVHRDAAATAELIGLLEDTERDVRHRAYVSLGHINKPAIQALIEVIADKSQPAKLRSSCMAALRGIGFRDESISKAIGDCLSEGQNTDASLLQSVLLTAAHLRDRGHCLSAAKELFHKDWKVVQAAAKYLTEVPAIDVFDQILDALSNRFDGLVEGAQRHLASSQLLSALFTTDRERSNPVIIRMIEDGLYGSGNLSAMEALDIAEKFGGQAAHRPPTQPGFRPRHHH